MKIEVGTLQEIGAKEGDVVEWSGGLWPRHWTISLIRGGAYYEGDDHEAPLSDEPYWRIISRANQGPVREVTTVRKEIVPGVYGKVEVHGMVRCGVVDVSLDENGLSRDELTAAIETLTVIRDAMADSSDDVSTAQAR